MSNHNQKHLTLSNRTYIEQELLQKSTFSSIGSVLHKDPSTISKEVKRYSKTVPAKFSYKCNLCKHYKDCDLLSRELLYPSYNNHYCSFYCKRCYCRNPTMICPYFSPYKCDKINKPPYVCNYCEDYKSCPLNKKIYDASYAQKQYEKNLYDSRKGINMSPEELQKLNDLISPLILKGQPLSHIFAIHADEIPVCRRTLYNYLDQRVFQARNIDLPRRVRYKKRKKKSEPRKSRILQQVYRNKRTYVDFERFMEAHPDLNIVEMDTVICSISIANSLCATPAPINRRSTITKSLSTKASSTSLPQRILHQSKSDIFLFFMYHSISLSFPFSSSRSKYDQSSSP